MNTTGWIMVTIFLTFLAILLQIAGYVAPMWIWIDVNSFRVGVGLWISTGCGLSGTCNTTSPTVAYTYGTGKCHVVCWANPNEHGENNNNGNNNDVNYNNTYSN